MACDEGARWPIDPTQRRLCILGSVSLALYVALLALSFAFRDQKPDPPILLAVALLAAATGIYFLALWCVLKPEAQPLVNEAHGQSRLFVIVGFAVAFRLLLLASWPIQEIDYYRYLWDGRVTLAGFNPYHYSPNQIDDATTLGVDAPAELQSLDRLAHGSEAVQTIFQGVHYRGVPTAYPPVAQLVFAAAALVTPADAPLWLHILVLKALLVAFDLATLGVVIALLRRLNLPTAWCLAYAWCPLVLKEFANSGHFDSIPIFFTALALLALVSMAQSMAKASRGREPSVETPGTPTGGLRPPLAKLGVGAMAALALGVLAKSYPVVLLPVVSAYLISRLGWRALMPLVGFVAIVIAGYLPFVNLGTTPLAGVAVDAPQPSHPGTGLGTFLTQWEMNDFLFMLVRENVRLPRPDADHWFVLVPVDLREGLHQRFLLPVAGAAGLSVFETQLSLLLTQLVMGLVLLALCLRWAWNVYRQPEPEMLLRAAFLTLAWSWLLSAAQNPWYLLWCLPFMVFAGQRSWFLLPGLVLLYYVRFWVEAHSTTGTVDVFDYGLVWVEYMPFFLALALETWWSRVGGQLSVVSCKDEQAERLALMDALPNGGNGPRTTDRGLIGSI